MDDLVAFIEARLTEDEKAARKAARFPYDHPSDAPWERARLRVEQGPGLSSDRHIARHDPARVLREVAALRAIVEECKGTIEWADTLRAEGGPNDAYARHAGSLLGVLKTFATVWREHPGFRSEWNTEENDHG